MKTTIKLILTLCLSLSTIAIYAAMPEVEHPSIISFEGCTAPFEMISDSQISISTDHYKHKNSSLKWSWDKKGAQIRVKQPIGYIAENPDPANTSVSTFAFWAYAKSAIGGELKFEFFKDGELCSWFTCNNSFSGWRGGWVAFDRDMEGTPCEEMDEMVITASAEQGEIYLDHIILSSFIDVRYHTAGFQLPKVNPDTDSHWLILLKSWANQINIPIQQSVSTAQAEQMATIADRLKELMMQGKAPLDIDGVRDAYRSYSIRENHDGTIKGKTIHFTRYAETYDGLIRPNNIKAMYAKNNQLLEDYNDLMFNVAVLYNTSSNEDEREELSHIYIMMVRHILDQGFAAGSEQGTLHHLGYSMRNFYTAPILMKDLLTQAGLDEQVQQAMEWFAGTGEVKLAPKSPGMDIDTFNTTLIGRFASIIMLQDSPYKVAYLQSLSRWLDNGYKITEGLAACFKSDGTLLHHRKHYPAYAIGGFDGGVQGIWLLHGTQFAISRQSHQIMKDALMHMRFYCNLQSFPLTLSGRHPDGKGKLIPIQYSILASAGSPDGTQAVDKELVEAYMRLVPSDNKLSQKYAKQGYKAEEHPSGTKFYAYNSSLSHRRENWLISAVGHSRYLWAAEHYVNANYYGRYLSHGSLIILGGQEEEQVTQFGSGFRQEGWDWSHIPGATAAARPTEELEAVILNVDTFSGFEEMLMSDQAFAGGITHKGENGAYAMKLHEHDKYNGSLRANKSYFMFDNRVVAIGSAIENNLKDRPAHTTLFQSYTGDGVGAMSFNGQAVEAESLQTINGKSVIIDNHNNAYLTPKGEVTMKVGLQHSLHEEQRTPTQNEFAVAYINHGDVVSDGSYEYMILVNSDKDEVERASKKLPYKVIEASSRAHIVYDAPTQTTGYVLFEAGEVNDKIIKSTSIPSLIMVSAQKDELTVSAADPDLRLYEGPSDEKFDNDGKRIERSIYSRDWIDNASIPSTISITLKGKWSIAAGDKEYCTAKIEGKNTTLSFICRESKTREVRLSKVK
ncbi:MAG: chondroitinase family polysaccharide lyase [Rikenellaceae bacterium]